MFMLFNDSGRAIALLVAGALCTSSCTLAPDYERPSTIIGEMQHFLNADTNTMPEADTMVMTAWWQHVDDPELQKQVNALLTENINLQAASARIVQAQAQAGISYGGLLPSFSVDAGRSRVATADSQARTGAFDISGLSGGRDYFSVYNAGATVSWQLDIFGKIRSGLNAAEATLSATEAEKEALTHSLIAELIRSRVAIAALKYRLQLAEKVVESRQQTLSSVEIRYKRGAASAGATDVYLARENLLSAEAEIPGLRAQLTDALYAVDVLLGKAPGTASSKDAYFPMLPPPRKIITPLPVALLDRRPDLRSAELRVVAANARIGVAIADLYPDLTLGAQAGTQANTLSNLWLADRLAGSIVSTVAATLFQGGSLRATIDLREAEAKEQAALYAGEVLEAVREVESALQQEEQLHQQLALRIDNVEAAVAAENSARDRYFRGIVPLLQLLETERRRAAAEQNLVLTQQQLWNNRIALYLALGGDWIEKGQEG